MSYANDMPESTIANAAMASQLRMSLMRLSRRLRAQRVDTSHTLSQLAALATVERHGPICPGELAAHEKVQPPSMTRIVAALEGDRLVQRSPHPTDGRQHLLTITADGRALLTADRRHRDAWLSRQLHLLDTADVETLSQLIPILDRLAGT